MRQNIWIAAIAITTLMACNNNSEKQEAQSADTEVTAGEVIPSKKNDGDAGIAMPSKEERTLSLYEMAKYDEDLTAWQENVELANLELALRTQAPITVFAPTNAAFGEIPANQINALRTPEKKEELLTLLSYHVVKGFVKLEDLKDGQKLETINGRQLNVKKTATDVTIEGARIATPNINAQNGIMHKINEVILPPKK